MFHRTLRGVVLGGVALALFAAPVVAAEVDTPDVVMRNHAPAMLPATAKLLCASPSRVTLVNTLLANPATKQVVTEAATRAGIVPANVGSVANTPIKAKIAPKLVAAAGAAMEYANINWSAGVHFPPFSPPKYSKGTYNLGEYLLTHATLRTEDLTTVGYFLRAPDENVIQYYLAELEVELPTGPSTYAMALHLSTPDGSCPAEWLEIAADYPYLFASMYVGTQRNKFVLTPLIGQPGFAGVVSADPQEQPKHPGSKMRTSTAKIEVVFAIPATVNEGHGLTYKVQSLVFGGITLTRL